MLKIEWIKQRVDRNEYYFTKHADEERQNVELSIAEVEEALKNGRILDQYEDTGRGESCLVAGFTDDGKPVHVVCRLRGDWLVIITVYIPTPLKFITPYERGKNESM